MFFLQPAIVLISLVSLEALAGHPLYNVPARSRKHHRQIAPRNMTTRSAPQAKLGPMTLVDKYTGKSFFE